ncbi:MAG: hypothetical protein IKS64_01155, partial [Muribaculaceae bacterium]|nr:hypothetical protein [Muribaculaceae bacterium]
KKRRKKLLPQNLQLFNILSLKPLFHARNAPPQSPLRLQIDKMPEKENLVRVCVNEKKALTLSVSNRPKNDINTFL